MRETSDYTVAHYASNVSDPWEIVIRDLDQTKPYAPAIVSFARARQEKAAQQVS